MKICEGQSECRLLMLCEKHRKLHNRSHPCQLMQLVDDRYDGCFHDRGNAIIYSHINTNIGSCVNKDLTWRVLYVWDKGIEMIHWEGISTCDSVSKSLCCNKKQEVGCTCYKLNYQHLIVVVKYTWLTTSCKIDDSSSLFVPVPKLVLITRIFIILFREWLSCKFDSK